MADNVLVNGVNVATNDIGGVHYQRTKATFGVAGTATDVSVANPLPVSLPSMPLPDGAASQSTLEVIAAALAAILSKVAQSGALIDRSGEITTGGSFQQVFAASSNAKHRAVQNPVDAAESLTLKIGSTEFSLSAGDYFERNTSDFMPTDAWQLKATTTGHAFIAGEA